MPLFDPFAHYLAYGATDQATFRDLLGKYSGVLVPATIAAFQRQGTGGFVLSLSATRPAPPYVIDPRFPLFQQGLARPKQSHTALAELLGDPALVRRGDPTPDAFPDARLEEIARQWVEFNVGYGTTSNEKFDKYAQRLGDDIVPEQAQGPEAVLAPYFACTGPNDPWWLRSRRLFDFTRQACVGAGVSCVRVVCAQSGQALGPLIADLPSAEGLAVWVSALDEHDAGRFDLITYRTAITDAASAGHKPFALYGGFFAVLLGVAGLRGAAHGIGFSEARAWRELPESGAPPARYYMRRAHRYVTQGLAQALFDASPDLTACPCEYCAGRPPVQLDYHELMKHSVASRAEEIDRWYGMAPADAARLLKDEDDALTLQIDRAAMLPAIRTRARRAIAHLPEWVAALRA
jgi:hypothetical protein